MEVISHNDFEAARKNWCEYHDVPYDMTSHPDFNELFGVTSVEVKWADFVGENVRVSNKTAKMVRLISGPYWRTILKAYEIKHGKVL